MFDRRVLCRVRHRYRHDRIEGPYNVNPVWASMFGNGYQVKVCARCKKEKRILYYIRTH